MRHVWFSRAPATRSYSPQFTIHAESCYELVIVVKDPSAPPTPVKFQKAEERGAIHVDKFKDSLPGSVPSPRNTHPSIVPLG
jgi:hypothetical protein